MSKKEKRTAFLIAMLLIFIMIYVWALPRTAEATEFSGNGEVYSSETKEEEEEGKKESSSSVPEKDASDFVEVKNEAASEVSNALDRVKDSVDDIFGNSHYDELNDEYETPEFVNSIQILSEKATITSSDVLAKLYLYASGLLVIHSVILVMFSAYYDYWKPKKFNFILKSVEYIKGMYGDGGNTSVSTTVSNGENGSVTQTVANTAKKATGPAFIYLNLLVNIVIEIAVTITFFLLIKVGFVNTAIQLFIKILVLAPQWLMSKIGG